MKKFSFQLEDVLSIRKFQQEQAEIELGIALGEEQRISNKLQMIAMQHAQCAKSIEGSVDFKEILSAQQYFAMLEEQKNFLLEELAKAKIVTEQKRKILQEQMKKTASLQKLRDKELENYKAENILEEEKIIDDIITSRYRK